MPKKMQEEEEIKKTEFDKLRQEILNCRGCGLYRTRTNPVIGGGTLDADIMFIGEAPGFNEDLQGKPFVGKAGKILDELLDSINLKREEIYITNILKCRPPQNKNPSQEEINACTPNLNKQIEIIKPKIICCLGNFATEFILKKFGLSKEIQGITKIHGKIFIIPTLTGTIKIIPLYHPAVATYNPNMIGILKDDFKVLNQDLKS